MTPEYGELSKGSAIQFTYLLQAPTRVLNEHNLYNARNHTLYACCKERLVILLLIVRKTVIRQTRSSFHDCNFRMTSVGLYVRNVDLFS